MAVKNNKYFFRMKKTIVALALILGTINVFSENKPLYKDASKPIDQRVEDLMSRMTIEEKIGQLNLPSDGDIITGLGDNSNIVGKIKKGLVGGMFNIKGVDKIYKIQQIAVNESRLGIPLIFGMDVIHGYETVFPIPLGLSATWDMDAIEQSAQIAAKEASADGINWTFSPMVDISRDPRWGRISEGNGEDPYLGGEIAKAMVRGYQGKNNTYSTNEQILACVKHFALYGAAEGGRDYNTVDMSKLNMYNYYLPPYKAAVDAGAASVMAAFNIVDGVPSHGNKWLLTDVLRNEWNFKGFTVADYAGVAEMTVHGVGDLQAASARALNAGLDMDMVSEGYLNTLPKSLKEGLVDEAMIDKACRVILEAKFKLGIMDNPYKYCDLSRPKKDIYTQKNREIARKTAAESFVLLKNEGNLLPIINKKNIAVVGPLANTRSNMVGTWSVAANLETPATLVEGLKSVVGSGTNITYAKGSNLTEDPTLEKNATLFGRDLHRDNRSDAELLQEALAVADKSDIIVAALGESSEMSGESSSRTNLDIPDVQKHLLKELLKTGKPVVLVLFTGRPLTLVWESENVPAILNVWFGGSEAAYAIGDVLFGKVNPSGKLTASFPRSVGQIPVYYNHYTTGRPTEDKEFQKYRSNYLDEKNSPLYPFGYGLSYTTFEYSDIVLSSTSMTTNSKIKATITIANTGKYDGKETVQLYIRDLVGSTVRPVKELKSFQKIELKAGEVKDVTFEITLDMLKFFNYDLNLVAEPGDFEVMIGTNSNNVKTKPFKLDK